jgi:hypothetical protein
MPPKKVNKSDANKNEEEIKSDSDTEIEESDVEESDVEESDVEESDVEESDLEDKDKKKKEKTKKLTFDELIVEINNISDLEVNLENEILELEKLLNTKNKSKSLFRKNKNKLIALLPKAHIDDINKVIKNKKKRTSNNKNGILREQPVPPILQKFLNIPENALLMRPKVFSLLNNKFKELGLKKGQETILDKKTAKLFELNEGHVIKFTECQKFLADIYEKANSKTNEVTL